MALLKRRWLLIIDYCNETGFLRVLKRAVACVGAGADIVYAACLLFFHIGNGNINYSFICSQDYSSLCDTFGHG